VGLVEMRKLDRTSTLIKKKKKAHMKQQNYVTKGEKKKTADYIWHQY
jgi:hypothetical protein